MSVDGANAPVRARSDQPRTGGARAGGLSVRRARGVLSRYCGRAMTLEATTSAGMSAPAGGAAPIVSAAKAQAARSFVGCRDSRSSCDHGIDTTTCCAPTPPHHVTAMLCGRASTIIPPGTSARHRSAMTARTGPSCTLTKGT